MSRVRLAGVLVGILLLLGLGGLLLFDQEQPGPTETSIAVPSEPPAGPAPPAPTSGQAAPPAGSAATTPESKAAEPAAQAPAPAQVETQTAARPPAAEPEATPARPPILPSFDVVRVEPSGEAVLAGRAEPRSRVRALDYDRTIGAVTADPQGQWVIVVEEPLAPGTHELGLEAETTSGAILTSDSVVIVTVPYPQVATAPSAPRVEPRDSSPPVAAPALGPPSEVAPEPAPSAPAVVAGATPDAAAVEPEPAPRGRAEPLASGETAQRPLAVLMSRSGEGPSRVLQQPGAPSEGLGEGTLVLETIDYAPNGAAFIGGRAVPNARLIVYLDDRPVGYGRADARGVWLVALDRTIAPGLHRLRIDQVEADGKVVARVETPFSAAASMAPKPDEVTVVVQPGNSLWRIARRVYGEGLRYAVIFAANDDQIADPDLIYPGQIFVVPLEN